METPNQNDTSLQESVKAPEAAPKKPLEDIIEGWLVYFLDMGVRTLVSLIVVSIIFLGVMYVSGAKARPTYFIIAAFLTSMLTSPLYSKIRIGNFLMRHYKAFLQKTFDKK